MKGGINKGANNSLINVVIWIRTMYGATCLADCMVVVKTAAPKSSMTYNFSHTPSGKWGTLWWETETHRPCWLLVTSEEGGNWTQQFFRFKEELPDVIKILFKEGRTWK